MKKQLLIAAVAATMSVSAMADISISGSAKANSKNGVASIESDLKITGKSGDTTVVANIALDSGVDTGAQAGDMVEDLYLTTSFQGVNIKAGTYRSGKSDLDVTDATPSARYNLSTTMGGIKLAYEAKAATSDIAISGTIAGVAVSHKIKSSDDTETTISGSVSGVNLKWNQEHTDSGDTNNTAVTVSTEFGGVTATYVKVDTDTSQAMDGYIGTATVNAASDASALGLSTSVAGNTLTFKKININSTDSTKIILTRPLASGATFEATYNDSDTDSEDFLDFELAVKF
jgi:hypothetical protein